MLNRRYLYMWMPSKKTNNNNNESTMFFYTLIFLDVFEFEGKGWLLSIDIPSPVSVEIKSCALDVLISLLVLLSFKLRRRMGVLEIIRLKIIPKWIWLKINIKLPKTRFSFIRLKNRWRLPLLRFVYIVQNTV